MATEGYRPTIGRGGKLKKPPSSYLLFVKHEFNRVGGNGRDTNYASLMVDAAQKWKTLQVRERERYQRMADDARSKWKAAGGGERRSKRSQAPISSFRRTSSSSAIATPKRAGILQLRNRRSTQKLTASKEGTGRRRRAGSRSRGGRKGAASSSRGGGRSSSRAARGASSRSRSRAGRRGGRRTMGGVSTDAPASRSARKSIPATGGVTMGSSEGRRNESRTVQAAPQLSSNSTELAVAGPSGSSNNKKSNKRNRAMAE